MSQSYGMALPPDELLQGTETGLFEEGGKEPTLKEILVEVEECRATLRSILEFLKREAP